MARIHSILSALRTRSGRRNPAIWSSVSVALMGASFVTFPLPVFLAGTLIAPHFLAVCVRSGQTQSATEGGSAGRSERICSHCLNTNSAPPGNLDNLVLSLAKARAAAVRRATSTNMGLVIVELTSNAFRRQGKGGLSLLSDTCFRSVRNSRYHY